LLTRGLLPRPFKNKTPPEKHRTALQICYLTAEMTRAKTGCTQAKGKRRRDKKPLFLPRVH
jgi:hypothetical protein